VAGTLTEWMQQTISCNRGERNHLSTPSWVDSVGGQSSQNGFVFLFMHGDDLDRLIPGMPEAMQTLTPRNDNRRREEKENEAMPGKSARRVKLCERVAAHKARSGVLTELGKRTISKSRARGGQRK
jgi:hypothetical protein